MNNIQTCRPKTRNAKTPGNATNRRALTLLINPDAHAKDDFLEGQIQQNPIQVLSNGQIVTDREQLNLSPPTSPQRKLRAS